MTIIAINETKSINKPTFGTKCSDFSAKVWQMLLHANIKEIAEETAGSEKGKFL
ncbi:hypothetical protein ACRBSI_004644 [Escherichia coli]|uniref:hypothetical protein n=1 Tax=Escherichia TaxID=561 RepID=UPI00050A60BD|nr:MULTISPECIES: hypothetical protein [Escherichia]HBN3987794.1 hypothetical protein [Escherichia coli O25b:H4-ST131]EHJ6167634.1 hypothetical protein [Escherichia coli]EHJ6171071.1 hypothetical protein [Escherichia coli]EHK1736838.1 hypothetical protein [Escherichia coli]EHN9964219.1 hypothetical protein [Escherichia coli]